MLEAIESLSYKLLVDLNDIRKRGVGINFNSFWEFLNMYYLRLAWGIPIVLYLIIKAMENKALL
jgi:hypothetical protein